MYYESSNNVKKNIFFPRENCTIMRFLKENVLNFLEMYKSGAIM